MIILFILLFFTGCSYLEIASIGTGVSLYSIYEYSKEVSPIARLKDRFYEEKLRNQWEKMNIDEPCLNVVFLEDTAIIIGGYKDKSIAQEAAGIAIAYAKDVHDISMSIIGKYNEKLVGKINTMLLFSSIASRNYFIYAIKSTVWIVGIAQSEEEKTLIIEKVKKVEGIKSVQSHIKIASKEYEKSEGDTDGYVVRF